MRKIWSLFLLFCMYNFAMSSMSETGRVDTTGINSPPVRYYIINVNTPGSLVVQLSALTGDADLYLYDPVGNQVDSSYAGGTTSEYCSVDTSTYNSGYYSTGGYIAKVVGYADASYVVTANYDKHIEVISLSMVMNSFRITEDFDFWGDDENYFDEITATIEGVNYSAYSRLPTSGDYSGDPSYTATANATLFSGVNTSYDTALKVNVHGMETGTEGSDDMGTIITWYTLSKKDLINGSRSSANNGNFHYNMTYTWNDILPPSEIPSITRNWSGELGNGYYNLSETNVKFTWTRVADVSGIDYYQYKIDSGSWVTTGNSGQDNFITINSGSDGVHTLYVRAVDNEGNANSGTTSINYGNDSVYPSAPGKPAHSDSDSDGDGFGPDTGYDDDTSLYFSWTSVSGASYYNVYLSENGGSYTYIGNTANNYLSVTGCANGENYRLKVTAVDVAGNEGTQSTASELITVDTSSPSQITSAPTHTDSDSGGDGVEPLANYDDDTNLDFSWMSISGAAYYNLYLSEDGGSFYLLGTIENNSYTIPDCEHGKSYRLIVTAMDVAGNVGAQSPVSASITVDTVFPDMVSTIPTHSDSDSGGDGFDPETGFDDDTSLYFSWNTVTNAAYYNIYLSEQGGSYNLIGNTVNNYISVTGCANGESYSLKVAAVDNSGNQSALTSGSDSITVDTTLPGQVTTAPTHSDSDSGGDGIQPSANYDDDTNLEFSWMAVSGIDYYNIYLSEDGGSFYLLDSVTTNTKIIPDCEHGKSYRVIVTTMDKAGNVATQSPTSASVTVDTVFPGAVTNIPVHSDLDSGADGIDPDTGYDDDSSLYFSWDAVTNANYYNLYLSEQGGAYNLIGNTVNNSASITGCAHDEVYSLKVAAVDYAGNQSALSSGSDTITVDLVNPSNVSGAPVHDDVDSGGDGINPNQYWDDDETLFFAWMSVSDADHYNLYLSVNGGAYNYIGESSLNSTSITGCEDGNYYKLKVTAVDNAGNESDLSISSERIDVDISAPTQPGNAPVHSDSDSGADGIGPSEYYDDDNSIYFDWDDVADGDYYNLYISENGGAFSFIGTTINSSVSIGGRSDGNQYRLAVTAMDYAGNESPVSSSSSNITIDTTPPTAPVLNTPANPYETNYVIVNIGTASSDSHFKYYRKWDSINEIWNVTAETTSLSFPNMPDTLITFKAMGVDYAGNVSSQDSVETTVNAVPPQQLTNIIVSDVVNDEGNLEICWHKPSDLDVVAYELYRTTAFFKNISNATLIKEIVGINQTNYIDTNVIDYQIYYYGVVAVDSGGKKNPLLATNGSAYSIDDKTPMDIVNFRGFPLAGGNSIILLWETNNDDTVEYEVYSSDDDTNYSLLSVIPHNNGALTNSGIIEDQWYYYRIIARDEMSNYSTTNATQVYSGDNAPPQKPMHSDGDSGNDGLTPNTGYDDDTTLYFTWSSVPDVDRYNIYVSEDGGDFVYVGNTVNNFINLTGCENGKVYRIKVSSVNSSAEESVLSSSSEPVIIDTEPPTTPQLIGLANSYNTNEIVVVMNTESSDANFDTYYKWVSVNSVWQSTTEDLTFTFTNLPDSYIIFRINGSDEAGNVSDYAEVDTIVNAFAPSAISNYTVYDITNAQEKLMVTWERPTDLDITSYELYRSLSLIKNVTNANRIAKYTNTSITNYLDTNVLNDTLYYYAVVAEDWEGKKNILAATNAIGKSIDDKAPMDILEFGGFSLGSGNANVLVWETNTDDTIGYEIYGSSNNIDFYLLQIMNESDYVYTNTGLVEDQWYYYKIYAKDEVDNSSAATICQVYAGDITPPEPPSYIEVEPLRWGTQIVGTRLKWKTDALDSYLFKIYRDVKFFSETNNTLLLSNLIAGTNYDGDTVFTYDDITTNHEGTYYYGVVPQDSSKHSNANHTNFTSVRGFSVDFQAPFVAVFMKDIYDLNETSTIRSTLIDSHHVQISANLRINTNSNWTKVYGELVSNANYTTAVFNIDYEPSVEYLYGVECYFNANDENGNESFTAAYKLDNQVTGTATSGDTVFLKYAEMFTNDITNALGDIVDVNGSLSNGYVTVPNVNYLDTGPAFEEALANSTHFLTSGVFREIYLKGEGTVKYYINISDLTNEMVPKIYYYNGENWIKPASRVVTNSTNRYVQANLYAEDEPWLLGVFFYDEYVAEPLDEDTIKSYPVPSRDDVTLDFTSSMDGRVEFGIYDISGKRIYNDEDMVYAGNDNSYTFDVSDYGCGVYILSISFYNEDSQLMKVYTKKIMVVK